MKEKYHNVGTVPQSYREIVEGGQTDTTNTHIHDLSRYWLQSYIKLASENGWQKKTWDKLSWTEGPIELCPLQWRLANLMYDWSQ
jgi:hypothetical protein